MRSGMLSPASARADARAAGRRAPDGADAFAAACIPFCCAGVRAAVYGFIDIVRADSLATAEAVAVTLFCASLMFAVSLTPASALTERLYKRLGFGCVRARAGCALTMAAIFIACGTVIAAYAASRYALSFFGFDEAAAAAVTAAVTLIAALEACAVAETAFIAAHALVIGRADTLRRALSLAFDSTRTETASLIAFSLSYLPRAALIPLTAGLYIAKLLPARIAATATLAETYLCAAEIAEDCARAPHGAQRKRAEGFTRGANEPGTAPGAQTP